MILNIQETYERTITSGVVSGSVEKGVRLGNARFARSFGGTSWNTIRVAGRFRFLTSSSFAEDAANVGVGAGARFRFGFSSGTDKVSGDIYADNCIAIEWRVALVGAWNSTYGGYLYNQYACGVITETSSSLNQYSDLIIASPSMYFTANTSSCWAFMVDLERTSDPTQFSASFFFPYNNQSVVHNYYPDSDFLEDIQQVTPSQAGHYFATDRGPYTIDEAQSGSINSVFCSWDLLYPSVELIDLYVVRLA